MEITINLKKNDKSIITYKMPGEEGSTDIVKNFKLTEEDECDFLHKAIFILWHEYKKYIESNK